MTFGRVYHHRKNIIFFKNVDKNYQSDFESTRYGKRKIKYVQITCFPWQNVLRQRIEICMKSIGIVVNHCVAFLHYVLRDVA